MSYFHGIPLLARVVKHRGLGQRVTVAAFECVITIAFLQAQAAAEVPFKTVVIDKQPPTNPWAKIVADFSGDGLPDVAIGGSKGPLVWYEYPSWKKLLIADGGYLTVEGEAADIDQDGDQDIVMGGIIWYENPGRSPDAGQRPWVAHRVAKVRVHDVEIGDLDGDGKLDLVTRNQSAFGNPDGNRFHIWKQRNPDSWASREVACPHGEGIRIGDLDRDGDLDVVIGSRWYENDGDIVTGHWNEHRYTSTWEEIDVEVQLHDLNQDGRLDVVLTPAEKQGGTYRISWFEAPVNAQDENWKEHTIEPSIETVIHALGVEDVNGDGRPDVVAAEMHQGADPDEVRLYINRGGGLGWTKQIVSTQGSHDIVLADMGADGDVDIVGANHGGPFQPVQLWENLTK